jgi:hypothetical protein
LVTFIAEAAGPEDAKIISEAAGPGGSDAFAGLGVAAGPVFAVMVARSFVSGVDPYERGASLERFRRGLLAILWKHVGR